MTFEYKGIKALRLVDGSVSCLYGDSEFYILPPKSFCGNDHIETALEKLGEAIEKDINEQLASIVENDSW